MKDFESYHVIYFNREYIYIRLVDSFYFLTSYL